MVLADMNPLKTEYGHNSLKVVYRSGNELKEKILAPSKENLLHLNELYANGSVISVHSMEASLSEIFRKLSGLT